jgi:hypothetical protein
MQASMRQNAIRGGRGGADRMPTNRRKILPRPRRPAWVERVLAARRPPTDWREWQDYDAWQQGRLAISGLPNPRSDEGQRLLRSMRVSLR